MEKRERTIRPNNVSETTTKKKTDDCIDDPPPTRRDRSRPTRRRRNAGKKDARARALFWSRRDSDHHPIRERERDQFKAQKCTQTSAENHSAEKKKKTHRRVVLADFAATTFAPVKLVLCAANIMSRRVVFCCGAFRVVRSRGHAKERKGEKKGGKSAHKIRIFFPSDFLSLSFFFANPKHMGHFFFKGKGREKIMPRVDYHEV